MLVINDASAPGVRYWQRSAVRTAWLGQGAHLLGLSGAVDPAALRSLLLGRTPGGGPLTARPGLRRRQGWDLVFAAPKSVSLLAASETGAAAPVRQAFWGAVADAFALLEERAAWARRGGQLVAAQGAVAGAFEHSRNDAGQPHLHAHVVLANCARLPGTAEDHAQWGCLVGNELWRWREGLGPGFQLALRARLQGAGLGFDWELSAGGLGEIRDVGEQDRASASSRSFALRAASRSFGSA
ncbi:MAG: MobF family relaxase [Acidimicrobiales bacterium]